MVNDIIWRAINKVQVPASKVPVGLSREDVKRQDGATFISWARGKPMAWDVTVPDTYARSHLDSTSQQAGAAADNAAIEDKIHRHHQYPHLHTSNDRDGRIMECQSHRTDPEHRKQNYNHHWRTPRSGLSNPTHLCRYPERKCIGLSEHIPNYRI